MSETEFHNFLEAYNAGKVCLHPCDTIPGLTFKPDVQDAWQSLVKIKKRDIEKPISGLVSSCEKAFQCWKPLPLKGEKLLRELWPAPLTVVWRAAEAAPKQLVSKVGEIGLRVPSLGQDLDWFQQVLEALPMPLPTTSVNESGQGNAATWAEAIEFLEPYDVYIPEAGAKVYQQNSTVIRIAENNDGKHSIECLREGSLPWIKIKTLWERL